MRSVSATMTRAATVAVLMAVAARLEAQVPTVQQVYDKYAAAVGGRDAWAKVSGRSERARRTSASPGSPVLSSVMWPSPTGCA